MDLPEEIAGALEPLFSALPPEHAMFLLVVEDAPPAAVVKQVEEVLKAPALEPEILRAGIWLYVDDLDRNHKICQDIDDTTGSFWHGIMHRREGDFPNSHYWFNKAGNHPAIVRIGDYEPHEYITAVESSGGRDPEELVATQRREWETLFRWCVTEYGG